MKKLLASILMLGALFINAGCGGDNDSPAAPQEISQGLTSVEGKIYSWSGSPQYFAAILIENNSVSMSEINSDGDFKLNLPAPIAPMLKQFTSVVHSGSLTVSDSAAKYAIASAGIMTGEGLAGYIQQADKQESANTPLTGLGSYVVQYWYFDRDVTISGSVSYLTLPAMTYYDYDIKCVKGWNKIVKRVTTETAKGRTYTYDTKIPDGKYFYMGL